MSADLGRIWADIQFWQQVEGDAKRTIYCEPHRVDELAAAVRREGLEHLLTVLGSTLVLPGRMLVVDTPGLEAVTRQAMQRPIKLFPPPAV